MNLPQTIVVADDDAPVRRVVARLLAASSRRVLAAEDGAKALALVAGSSPDLVLLDIDMPGLSGLEVLDALRGGTRSRLVPVIMLTGAASAADRVRGLDRGADDYVTKPFDGGELRARVEALLRRHGQSLAANPLSGLPGNVAIEEEVERRIRAGRPFSLLHADIDRFKAFNDAHGFAAGDEVLLETSRLVREAAGEDGFAGHIGGDDFALVTSVEEAPHAAHRLAALFDEKAEGFQRGDDERPLTLSIGAAGTARRVFDSYAAAAAAASAMKGYLKSRPDARLSRFAFDRRSGA